MSSGTAARPELDADPAREYERQIAASIRARASAYNVKPEAMADALGLSVEAVNRRMREQTPWSLGDLARIAPLFGVEPSTLAVPVHL